MFLNELDKITDAQLRDEIIKEQIPESKNNYKLLKILNSCAGLKPYDKKIKDISLLLRCLVGAYSYELLYLNLGLPATKTVDRYLSEFSGVVESNILVNF